MTAPVDGLPHDPALPRLAQALDELAMAAAFGDLLRPHGRQVEHCRVERVKYRPRRSCSISYRLQLRDVANGRASEQRVAARLCSGGESLRRHARAAAAPLRPSAAGPALHRLPALDMLAWWWPNDPKLDAPSLFADETFVRERLLPDLVDRLTGGDGRLLDHRIEVVQYVPELRLCARVDLVWQQGGRTVEQRVYAKASRERDAAAAHAHLLALQTSAACRDGRLRTPRALHCQPQAGLHWQESVPGRPWLDLARPPIRLAAALGAQLAALHATPVPTAQPVDPDGLGRQLAHVVEVLSAALPDQVSDLRRAAVRLEAGLQHLAAWPAATLHGDLHPRNLLVDGDGLTLIDLDDLQRGPALLELGAWVADGIYRALLDGAPPTRDQVGWHELLHAYAASGGRAPSEPELAWATAWSLLTQRAWRCVVNLKPGRWAIAPRLITMAAQWVGEPALEPA